MGCHTVRVVAVKLPSEKSGAGSLWVLNFRGSIPWLGIPFSRCIPFRSRGSTFRAGDDFLKEVEYFRVSRSFLYACGASGDIILSRAVTAMSVTMSFSSSGLASRVSGVYGLLSFVVRIIATWCGRFAVSNMGGGAVGVAVVRIPMAFPVSTRTGCARPLWSVLGLYFRTAGMGIRACLMITIPIRITRDWARAGT